MFLLERTEHPRSLDFKFKPNHMGWKRVNIFNEYDIAKLSCDDLNILDDGLYRVKRVYDSEVLYSPNKQHEVKNKKRK